MIEFIFAVLLLCAFVFRLIEFRILMRGFVALGSEIRYVGVSMVGLAIVAICDLIMGIGFATGLLAVLAWLSFVDMRYSMLDETEAMLEAERSLKSELRRRAAESPPSRTIVVGEPVRATLTPRSGQ